MTFDELEAIGRVSSDPVIQTLLTEVHRLRDEVVKYRGMVDRSQAYLAKERQKIARLEAANVELRSQMLKEEARFEAELAKLQVRMDERLDEP